MSNFFLRCSLHCCSRLLCLLVSGMLNLLLMLHLQFLLFLPQMRRLLLSVAALCFQRCLELLDSHLSRSSSLLL